MSSVLMGRNRNCATQIFEVTRTLLYKLELYQRHF